MKYDNLDQIRNLDQTGQHYMIDKVLIKFIVNIADLENEDVVLEIGYGKGALTRELVKKCKIIAIDIDKNDLDFIDGKLRIVHGNILDMFDELYEKYSFNKIVANIPYNISEPLMRILFKHSQIEEIILTIGKNFADILQRTDSRIGIIANHLYDIELLQLVSPKAFNPRPKVDSAVIHLEPKMDSMSKLYSQLVMLDDMKLKNAFEKIFIDKTKKEVKELTTLELFNKKLYELSNKEFLELDEILKNL